MDVSDLTIWEMERMPQTEEIVAELVRKRKMNARKALVPYSLRIARIRALCWIRRRRESPELGTHCPIEKRSLDEEWRRWRADTEFYNNRGLDLFEGRTVLDVGCGTGLAMELFKEKGFEVEGTDLDPVFVDYCVSRGLKVWKESAEEISAENKWDNVFSRNVVEHLKDDHEVLQKMLRACKECVIFIVPEASFKPPHINYYFLQNIVNLVKRLQKEKLIGRYSIEYGAQTHLPSFTVKLWKWKEVGELIKKKKEKSFKSYENCETRCMTNG